MASQIDHSALPPVTPVAADPPGLGGSTFAAALSRSRGLDVTVPSPARMYNHFLGGKDNFPADREAAERVLAVVPQGREVAWANRRFMVRAVRYLARCGIRQFIDLGTGIPTSPNVHQAARAISPQASVVYVDNDPVVTTHNRALLANDDNGVAVLHGDIRYPLEIIESDALRHMIDFSEPVAVLFVAVLHFTNGDDPYNSVYAFRDRMCRGSHLVGSHITSDGTEPSVMATISAAYANATAPAVFRTRDEIGQFFAGVHLVKPGLVEVSEWRSGQRKTNAVPALRFLCGVGKKL